MSLGGDVTVNCKDWKSFLGKEGLTPADDPDEQVGTAADLAQGKKQFLLILRWERREELAHFRQRLANYLAGG